MEELPVEWGGGGGVLYPVNICVEGTYSLEEGTIVGQGEIISPPPDVTDTGATNLAMQGFDEVQGFVYETYFVGDEEIEMVLPVDSGSLSRVTVDSHMIFMNPTDAIGEDLLRHLTRWTFDMDGGNTQIRAERAGSRNGRVYTISFTGDDGYENGTCSGEVTVCVPKSPREDCVDDGLGVDSTQP